MKQFILKNQTTILILLVVVVGYISYKMFYTPKSNTETIPSGTKVPKEGASFDGNLDNSPIV